jgi:hypothetical protein
MKTQTTWRIVAGPAVVPQGPGAAAFVLPEPQSASENAIAASVVNRKSPRPFRTRESDELGNATHSFDSSAFVRPIIDRRALTPYTPPT